MKRIKIIIRNRITITNNTISNNWVLLDSRHSNQSARRGKRNLPARNREIYGKKRIYCNTKKQKQIEY